MNPGARNTKRTIDPLLAVPVREAADVEIGGLVAEGWRGPVGRRVLIAKRRRLHDDRPVRTHSP